MIQHGKNSSSHAPHANNYQIGQLKVTCTGTAKTLSGENISIENSKFTVFRLYNITLFFFHVRISIESIRNRCLSGLCANLVRIFKFSSISLLCAAQPTSCDWLLLSTASGAASTAGRSRPENLQKMRAGAAVALLTPLWSSRCRCRCRGRSRCRCRFYYFCSTTCSQSTLQWKSGYLIFSV